MNAMLAQAGQVVYLAGMAFLLMGNFILTSLGIPVPALYTKLQDNKLMAIGGLFLFNSLMQQLVLTGAFEIHLNGQEIFSKLKEGRMPTIDELIDRLEDAGLASN